MHHRLFVLLDKNQAKTADEAISHVNTYLGDEGFVETEKRFAYGVADWYVMGGRWSGELQRLRLAAKFGREKIAEYWKDYEKEELHYYKTGEQEKRMQSLKADLLMKKHFPNYKGINPFHRDNQYNEMGASDDAEIIDEEMWKGLQTAWDKSSDGQGFPEYYDVDSGIIDTDAGLEGDIIKKEDIVGKKWIVVVDYHT